MPSQPSEMDRVLTSGQSTKIPLGSTNDVSHQEYKKLEDRLETHEQLNESILTSLQRMEGNCCEISSLKEDIKHIKTKRTLLH